MLNRICWLLLVTCLVIGNSWAADDPFVGKWKVNPSKSKLTDEMKVGVVGENKYAFTFGPGAVDTIVADGTDQPAMQGTTLSVTVEGPNNWKVVRKKESRTTIMANWTLSADGKTLDDDLTAYQPDGSPTKVHFTYQRSAAGSGFPGTWDSASAEVDSSIELRSSHTRVTAFHLAVPRCNSIGKPSSMGRIMRAPVPMCRLALHLLAVV